MIFKVLLRRVSKSGEVEQQELEVEASTTTEAMLRCEFKKHFGWQVYAVKEVKENA